MHAVVVLVPLTALGGLGISLLRKLRTRYGTLVAAVGLVAAVISLVQVIRIGHSGATAVWGSG